MDPRVLYLEHMSVETLDVAKSHTSWMNLRADQQFQDISKVQFTFQYIKSISSLDEYRQLAYCATPGNRVKPLIVVTSLASFGMGLSQQIFSEFAARDTNEIIMIEKPSRLQDTAASAIFRNKRTVTLTESQFTQKTHVVRSLSKQSSTHLMRKQSIEEVLAETHPETYTHTIAETEL